MRKIMNKILYSDIVITMSSIHMGVPLTPQLMNMAKDIFTNRKA